MRKKQWCLKYVLPHLNLHQLAEKSDLEQTYRVFFNEPICILFGINLFTENLVSAIRLFKWLLISLNTEKLRSASAYVAGRVHPITSKIIKFEEDSGSADTKEFIKVSGKSALSDRLEHTLDHLDASLSNDLEVGRLSL